jgi:hypothetical protein
MKPQELSKKLNPLGENMNLSGAFKKLTNTKHEASFENLGDWLNNNTSKPKKMKTFYKIAASFLFTAFVLIACSIPVQNEEAIGYMIKGVTTNSESELVENMKKAKGTFGNQIVMSFKVTEEIGQEPTNYGEVILLLPNADEAEARSKMDKLSATFNFVTIDLLPIEETVKKPLYEAALSKININFDSDLSDEIILERFNEVLHEKSNVSGQAEISIDENGNKVVEILITEQLDKNRLNQIDPTSIKSIRITKDADGKKVVDIDIKEEVKN